MTVEVLPDPARRWLLTQRPEGYTGWWPATGAQEAALDNDADILLFGGSVGSLKTSTLLLDLIQERDYPRMNSYFFRKTYPAMEDAMQQASSLFPQTGAVSCGTYNGQVQTWRWPSGAMFRFRQLANQADVDNSYGKQMSAMAFDESTHFEETIVRQMIVRNRSTDPGLAIRVRLGTNPGGVGAPWHMKMFFNGVCPHCERDLAPPEGELRWDVRWPSDGTPLEDTESGRKVSVAYILGKLRDHALLGGGYAALVKMQNPALAQALLDGCWLSFIGQFFRIWEPRRPGMPMVIPRAEVGEQWFWPRWVGSDFGFTISTAAAHLCVRSPATPEFPRGRVYVIGEYTNHEQKAVDFARSLVDKWVLDSAGNAIEYRWHPWYLSPDAWAERGRAGGAPFNLALQMNAEMERHGTAFFPARNDRIGGWMRLYTMLESGELVICDNCAKTIEAIPSRVRDEDHENDVLKVMGDELDDVIDSLRYAVYSFVTADDAAKPAQVRVAERMEKIFTHPSAQGNQDMALTTAMLKKAQIEREEYQEEQPVYSSARMRRRLAQRNHRDPV